MGPVFGSRYCSGCSCLIVTTVAGQAVRRGAVQPTFRSGIDLVTFGVTAIDRRGNLITDLTADDFEIVEDGRPQADPLFRAGR